VLLFPVCIQNCPLSWLIPSLRLLPTEPLIKYCSKCINSQWEQEYICKYSKKERKERCVRLLQSYDYEYECGYKFLLFVSQGKK